jgi:hypothetical protein
MWCGANFFATAGAGVAGSCKRRNIALFCDKQGSKRIASKGK